MCIRDSGKEFLRARPCVVAAEGRRFIDGERVITNTHGVLERASALCQSLHGKPQSKSREQVNVALDDSEQTAEVGQLSREPNEVA